MTQLPDGIEEETSTKIRSQGPIDWSVLNALKSIQKPGQPDVRKRLTDAYLFSAPELLKKAASAIAVLDRDALKREAHSLKSCSLAIGATQLGAICYELEILGGDNMLENTPSLLRRAEDEFVAVCSVIRKEME